MNWWLLSPEISIALTLVLILGLDMGLGKAIDRKIVGVVGVLGILISLIFTFSLFGNSGEVFEGILLVDNLGLFFKVLFLMAALLVFFLSSGFFHRVEADQGEYFWLSLAALLGMMITAASRELVTIYVGIELISLSFYGLVGFRRGNKDATEGALKYFILGSFAIALWLYGAAMIYGLTGQTDLLEIAHALSGDNPVLLYAGIFLMVVGFGFKLGLAPFHSWVPDAYQVAPSPITAFLAVGSKAAAFGVLIRVMFTAFGEFAGFWSVLLAVIAALTMFWGNLAALRQKNIKRMLAYSAIAHAGYALVGVVSATVIGVEAVIFYLLGYLFANLGAFGVVVAFAHFTGSDLIEDYAGLRWRNPFLAVVLALCLLSMAGIPPLAGFLGKFYIFWAAMQQGSWLIYLVVIGAVNSAISLFYYVNVIRTMFFIEPANKELITSKPAINFTLFVATAGIVLAVFYFQPVLSSLQAGNLLSLM